MNYQQGYAQPPQGQQNYDSSAYNNGSPIGGMQSPEYLGSGKKLTKFLLAFHILACLLYVVVAIIGCVIPQYVHTFTVSKPDVGLTATITAAIIYAVIMILWLHLLLWLKISFRFRNARKRWVVILLLIIDGINTLTYFGATIYTLGLFFPMFLYHCFSIFYDYKIYKDPHAWGCRPFNYENHMSLEGKDPVTGYPAVDNQGPPNQGGGYQGPPNQGGGYR